MKVIKVDLTKGFKQLEYAISDIEFWRERFENAINDLADYIYNLIINRANEYLNADSYTHQFKGGNYSTKIRVSWQKEIIDKKNHIYKIINTADESVYAEFGTGLVGSSKPHPVASDNGYVYDQNKHGEEGWTFYNKEAGLYLKGFTGYAGNQFLYKAMQDVINKTITWREQWQLLIRKYDL